MNSIVTIIGARPQFIKCAPVSKLLRNDFEEILVHTGQHYDDNMSKVFFDQLNIPKPDHNLNVGSASHAIQTANIMIELEKVILFHKPDLIIIYGDTNSTLAGAVVGAKLHIPIAHIEAGLRSYNKQMPEELNRIAADHYSEILFCPSDISVVNLKKEGIEKNVYMVGDVMKDAVLQNIEKIDPAKILKKFNLDSNESFYFFTMHRQENTDNLERFNKVIEILKEAEHKVIFAAHPRTKKILKGNNFLLPPNVYLIEPVNYIESLFLQKSAKIIMTDSGGIQKEAYFLNTPCITLRDETEWVETVQDGWNEIVGIDIDKFIKAQSRFLNNIKINTNGYYGDGKASEKIVKILCDRL